MTATKKNPVLKQELKLAVSRAVRELRERHPQKPTQEMLAARIHMDPSYWGDLERGERALTLYNLWRMAEALEISPIHLVRIIYNRHAEIRKKRARVPALFPRELKRLREVMDLSPAMMWIADPNQRTLYCNRPLLDFMGVAFETVADLGWKEMLHPDDLEKQLTQNKKAYAHREPFLSRFRMRCADGQYRAVVQHAVPQVTLKGVFLGMMGTMIEDPAGH